MNCNLKLAYTTVVTKGHSARPTKKKKKRHRKAEDWWWVTGDDVLHVLKYDGPKCYYQIRRFGSIILD